MGQISIVEVLRLHSGQALRLRATSPSSRDQSVRALRSEVVTFLIASRFWWPKSSEEHRQTNILGVLRLLSDRSARRFAQDDGFVGVLKNLLVGCAKSAKIKSHRLSRDDKFKGGGPPWQWWRGGTKAGQQILIWTSMHGSSLNFGHASIFPLKPVAPRGPVRVCEPLRPPDPDDPAYDSATRSFAPPSRARPAACTSRPFHASRQEYE
jgi:hypothetical protein